MLMYLYKVPNPTVILVAVLARLKYESAMRNHLVPCVSRQMPPLNDPHYVP